MRKRAISLFLAVTICMGILPPGAFAATPISQDVLEEILDTENVSPVEPAETPPPEEDSPADTPDPNATPEPEQDIAPSGEPTISPRNASGLLASYDMTLTSDHAALQDQSGSGNDAPLVGFTASDVSTDGTRDVLTFSGDRSKYVKLPKDVMPGANFSIEAILSTNVQADSWLFSIGTKEGVWPNVKNYIFLSPISSSSPGKVRTGINDGASETLIPNTPSISKTQYNMLTVTYDGVTYSLYVNGVLVASNAISADIQSIITNGVTDKTDCIGYIGKSIYTADPAFTGKLSSFKVYDTVLDADEIASSYDTAFPTPTDAQKIEQDLDALIIPHADETRGNITLPTLGENGSTITWASSNTAVISVSDVANPEYDTMPAGVVTRGATDTNVQLTATFSLGAESRIKNIPITVLAAPTPIQESDYTDYMFVGFASDSDENVYFATSQDSLRWKNLNDNKPILTSSLGTKGLRDPHIIRSAEGDKFFLIATDLKVNAVGWGAAQSSGSQSLMVWESTDLVTWTDERLVEVSANINAGCTWAPEAYYDKETREYIVFWASRTGDSKHRMYYAKTRDFYTFTDAKLFFERDWECIDATIIEHNDAYYRFTKNESGDGKYIFAEKTDTLLSEVIGNGYTPISSSNLPSIRWVEGPTIFKLNQDDILSNVAGVSDSGDQWCIWLDDFGGNGYYPLITDNLDTSNFVKLDASTISMPSNARHGTVMRITSTEYNALMQAYYKAPPINTDSEQQAPVLDFNFNDGTTPSMLTLHNHAEIKLDAERGTNVLTLDGSTGTYASLPEGWFDGRNKFTIDMDVKSNITGNAKIFTFAIGKSDSKHMFFRTRENKWSAAITTAAWSGETGVSHTFPSSTKGTWHHVTITVDGSKMRMYMDNVLVDQNDSVTTTVSDLGHDLNAYFGKSFYSRDGYFNGSFDNIRIYNRALTDTEITGIVAPIPAPLLSYTFDSLSGQTIADDSGNGHDATVSSGGIVDGSLKLDGSNYVTIPQGTFDGQDTLTISTWMKNETGKGNYAGLYIGTDKTGSCPTSYWLMNPQNPSGLYKSVFTNSVNGSAPYQTEVGISPTQSSQGVSGVATDNQWRMYTTVITPTSITAYYDGQLVGTYSLSRTLSSFGSNLLAYIGKSPYSDPYMKGNVQNLQVYAAALTKEQVLLEYYNTASNDKKNEWLSAAKDALQVTPTTVISNLTLPSTGLHGTTITWSSSDASVISNTGIVTRPALGNPDASVTLTATITNGDVSVQKDFTITVLENAAAKTVNYYADTFQWNYGIVTQDITLASTAGDATVTWHSDNSAITENGTVTRPAVDAGNAAVTMTATFAYGGTTTTRTYPCVVLETSYASLLTYIKTGDTARTDALHYAVSTDGATYEALANNQPILYLSGLTNRMGSPSMFRKADGSFGLIATEHNATGSIYLYDSSNLITFTGERKLTLTDTGTVQNATCAYDSALGVYRIVYSNGTTLYSVETQDFETFSTPHAYTGTAAMVTGTLPADATQASSFELTKAEYAKIVAKYSRVHNTDITVDNITVTRGTRVTLPTHVSANYTDGSQKQLGVTWNPTDVAAIDSNKTGTYTINGTVNQPQYDDVLVEQRADPWVFQGDDGFYYFTGSYPVAGNADSSAGIGYDRIVLRRSETLQGLSTASEVTIWHQQDSAIANRYIWAPEIHQINGKWYVFFTASVDSSVWSVRPFVLECVGTDPMDPESWKTADQSNLHRCTAAAGDAFAFTGFSLDMTHFEANGTHYVVWAQKPSASNLYIATVNSEAPWQLTSPSVLLSTPDFAWEKAADTVDEGPAILIRDGKIMLFFSAASTDYTYCVGVMTADVNADLLDIASWTKNPYPLLTTDDLTDQYGPGHNSFALDENGNIVIVYHARPYACDSVEGTGSCGYVGHANNPLIDPCRHARIKAVSFAADGFPILNMTAQEELASANKNVSITVTVTSRGSSSNQNSSEQPTTPVDPDPAPKPPTPTEPENPFVDVTDDAWYYDSVMHVLDTGAMKGTSATTFEPNTPLSRAMFAQMLYRLSGNNDRASSSAFRDVTSDSWYYDAVNWASQKGIVQGYGNGTFGPNDTVTREQYVVMLYRYAKMKGNDITGATSLDAYTDAQNVSDWATPAMQWAIGKRIVNGITLTTIVPQDTVTRAQCAKMMMEYDSVYTVVAS